jgi:anti-anti-sigma factor
MPREPFSLHAESIGDRTHVLQVRGELGAATSLLLTASLHQAADAGRTHFVVDLGETTWLDSTALGRLLVCARMLRRREGRLVLVGSHHAQPRGRLDMARTGEVLTVCASLAEAVALLEGPAGAPSPVVPDVVRFVLYVNGASPSTPAATEQLHELRRRHLPTAEVQIVDIVEHPEMAERERLVAVPTLVRTWPAPARRIVGDLSDHRQVLDALGLNETRASLT